MALSWRLVLAATIGSSTAYAQPETTIPPDVPLVIVDPPSTFDLDRLHSALETYLPNAQVKLLLSSEPSSKSCEDTLAAATEANSSVGLWLHWAESGAVLEMVGQQGCSAVTTSVVDVPAEQPTFVYRVVALKVASLLQEMPPHSVRTTDPRRGPIDRAPYLPTPRVLSVGASGIASADAEGRVFLASLGAWIGRQWIVGGDLRVSLARDVTAAGGTGSARELGAFVGVRRHLVERASWAIDATAEVGVVGVYGSATRSGGSDAMSDTTWTAAAALAPSARFALVGPLAITVGPTLELLARPVDYSLGVSPLYHASRVRLRGDIHVELSF